MSNEDIHQDQMAQSGETADRIRQSQVETRTNGAFSTGTRPSASPSMRRGGESEATDGRRPSGTDANRQTLPNAVSNGNGRRGKPEKTGGGTGLKPLREQVVVVFGASSGIGREAALRFARQGAKVVVSARSAPGLESLVAQIRGAGGKAIAVPADAADFAQVQAVANAAVAQYGRLDTWAHLAGIALYALFEQTTPEEFARVVQVNLMGQVYGAMAALPHLRRQARGALIHVSSVEAMRPLPYHSAYAAAKHGVHGFVQTLRMELHREGLPVSVTEVMPASINTPLFDKARTRLGVKPMGLPPIYPPYPVAEAVVHAATHPTREIVVGGAGQVMLLSQRLSPRLTDAMMERAAFQGQRTHEPKPDSAPSNLFAPVAGLNTVEGSQPVHAPALPPQRAWALGAAALLTGLVLAGRRSSAG